MKVPEPRKLSSGSWFIQLRLNGQSIPVVAQTKTECKRQAELIKAEHRNGKRTITQKKKDELTIGEILDRYIDDRSKVLSPSTVKCYTQIRNNHFQNYINKKPSAVKNWQMVINDEISNNASPKTVKNSYALLKSALKAYGYQIDDVALPQIMPSTRPWLDAQQIKEFVSAVHGKDCEIAALLGLHSLRRSEILALTWDKIDLKHNTIRIEGSAVIGPENKLVYKKANKTKNSARTIPIMIPELKSALESIPESERAGNIYKKSPSFLWVEINKVCKEAGLPEIGVHGLRHSFASLAHHVGLPEQEAMLIGGWEDAQTMHKIYTHISNADKLKYQNKISEFFKNAN